MNLLLIDVTPPTEIKAISDLPIGVEDNRAALSEFVEDKNSWLTLDGECA